MGLKEFGRGVLDGATDIAASAGMKTAVDWATEPVERVGNVLTGVGKGINAGADWLGEGGDMVQRNLDKAGAPSWVGSGANFFSGGGAQWLGRSAGDLSQTAGTLGENIDTIATGSGKLANFVDEHPGEAQYLAGKGLDWAAHHKGEIAGGVGKALLEEATDPAGIALALATGGGSAALKGGAVAATKAFAEGGVRAGIKAGVAEGGAALLRGGTRAAVEESAEAATTAVGKTTIRQAATEMVKDTITGRNLPAADTPGVLGKLDRALERGMFRPNPNGRLARFRAGQAERIVGEKGGLVRETLANRVRAGGGKPLHGGEAAVNAWRAKNIVKNTGRLESAGQGAAEAATIAADPAGYAMKKMFTSSDTATTGAVTSSSRANTSITGDLVQPTALGSNQFAPKGAKASIQPGRGATDLTSSESVSYEVKDPYAEGTEYGQAETSFKIKDPYQSLTQPKEKPKNGVLKPNKKSGVYA